MGEAINSIWREYNTILNDAGIDCVDSLKTAINNAEKNDKLVLVYFHDSIGNDNRFIRILLNNDINSLFKKDFCVYISDAADTYRQSHFKKLLGLGDNSDRKFSNSLFVLKVVNNSVTLAKGLNVLATSQEDIVYDLYLIHEKFQLELMKKNEKIVEECAKLYLDDLQSMDPITNFEYMSLQQTLEISMNEPYKHLRKILMLYMYKEKSSLSELFNNCLRNGLLKKYQRLFVPIFWNISDPKYHKQLQIACRRYFDEPILEKTITSKEGGIFIFVPDEGQLKSVPKVFTSITRSDMYDLQALTDTLEYLFSDFQSANQITDLFELEAINSFSSTINNSFMQNLVDPNTLHDITEMCLQVPRKMLLLYFGVQSANLWSNLSEVSHLLFKNQVVLLPWDISEKKVGKNLKLALKRSFGIKKMEIMLANNKTALFLFVPIGKTLILYSVMEYKTSASDIAKVYKEAHQFFMLESQLAENFEDNCGPIAYQQAMCEQLCDRDFDCFQLDKEEGEQLKAKIAFAYYGPPKSEDEPYDNAQTKQIEKAFGQIKSVASQYGENENMLYLSFMRVCITSLPAAKAEKYAKDDKYEPYLDFGVLPLFGIRKCFNCLEDGTACRSFIDHTGRVYESWEDFLENNRYPKMLLIAPKNGKYTCDYRGSVQLEICTTPACNIGPAVMKGVDIGASVLGGVFAVGGIVTTIISIPILPLIALGGGVTVGVYSIVRSSMTIADRVKYGESMSLGESEARGAYLNILAGSLGFATAGASFAMAYAAKTGASIGMAARVTMNGITVANITASGAAIGNSAYDIISNWSDDGTTNTLAILQLTSSILFFGHAVYNVQMAGTIIQNAQRTTLSEFIDSLSSNRQRKTFMRLLNATAEKTGSVTGGNAEVISYIRKLDNVQDVIKVLTRDTKLMSKNGIKYSVDNGKVVFNGFEMNVNEFGNLSKIQRNEVLASIPGQTSAKSAPAPAPVNVTKSNIISVENLVIRSVNLLAPAANILLNHEIGIKEKIGQLLEQFSPYIQEELIIIMGKFLEKIGAGSRNMLYKSLQVLYPDAIVPIKILDIIIQYFKSEGVKTYLAETAPFVNTAIELIEKAIIMSMSSMASLIAKLLLYCSKWVTQEAIQRETDPSIVDSPKKRKINKCNKCGGEYYK